MSKSITDGLDASFLTIDPEVLLKAKEAVGEDDERRQQTVKMIREWLKKQPHLTYPDGNINAIFGHFLFELLIFVNR